MKTVNIRELKNNPTAALREAREIKNESMGSDSIDFMIFRLNTATTIHMEVEHGTLTQICYPRPAAA